MDTAACSTAVRGAVASIQPASLVDARAPDAPRPDAPAPGTLVPATCAFCGDDDGVPVAVGTNFADPADAASYLVLRCRRCHLFYLNPRPAPGRVRDGGAAAAERVRGWLRTRPRELPPGGDVLAMDGAAGAAAAGAYDVALFAGTLERYDDPITALVHARMALRSGGRVVVIAANAGGAAARLFAGRHWAGYDFPHGRFFFDARTLRAAASRAGLAVERLVVRYDGRCWAGSLEYLLADVGGPPHPADRVRATHPAARAALRALGAALDAAATLVGRGARLEATLRPSV
ncbi:hypothetical protein tb265_25920 [Gemmatimonadetes bacterium T265]|nr:hypothetical protein tb265_25920 [Gemmatimonadetes bacterium T265]